MNKYLKKQVASVALSMALAGSSVAAMNSAVYAEDEDKNLKQVEQTIDEEQEKEEVQEQEKEEVQEQEKTEVQEESKEEVQEESKEEAQEQEKEESQEQEKEEAQEQEKTEVQEESKEEVQEELKAEVQGQEKEESKDKNKEKKLKTKSDNNESNQIHKVIVVTDKVDENGNPLKGAVLQILDEDGNVVDEWVSDGSEHVSLLPEGNYILHEKTAPKGYSASEDKAFEVKVEDKDINAGVDHDGSHDVCWHYGGVPLYYIESEGEKEEVYCINQNWEEPNNTNYNGLVLTPSNLRSFTPDADTSMSDNELYDKVLDIVYHRSKAEEKFPNLSEVEIRFITEYALKTYTSAEVVTRQAKRDENGKIIRDEEGNIVYENIRFLRYYRYDPDSPKGYVVDPVNGNGVGKLAEHWYNQHNKTKIPEEYVQLFNYLVSNDERHPSDMHLYIYSTKSFTDDGESYQNLVGVRWFDPYDEDYKTYLSIINNKENIPDEPEKPDKPQKPEKPDKPHNPDKPQNPEKPDKPHNPEKTINHKNVVKIKETPRSVAPNTGDNSFDLALALSTLGGSVLALSGMVRTRKRFK